MFADEIRFLYGYDRWATRRLLAVLDGLDPAVWARPNAVGELSLGMVLVHQLGAAKRWRIAFQTAGSGEGPDLEAGPLPPVEHLRQWWEAEWAEVDAWLPALTDEFVNYVFEGVPVWQMMVHLINHGTQHRSEAAALLSAEGRSPGELDLIDYAESLKESD